MATRRKINHPSVQKAKDGILASLADLEVKAMEIEGPRPSAEDDFDIAAYIEKNLQIQPKQGGHIPFVLWPKQREICQRIQDRRRKHLPIKIIHLKCRQIGSTTFGSAVIFSLISNLAYRKGKIIAHRKGPIARDLFSKQEMFYEWLPDEEKKRLPLKSSASGKKGHVNVDRLEYDHPHGSTIAQETAGGRAGELGRSGTVQYQLWTEFAWWENQESNYGAAKATVPDKNATWDTVLIIESTANGQEKFKELWDNAQSPDSEYIPVFTGIKDDPTAWDEIIPGKTCQEVAEGEGRSVWEVAADWNFTLDAEEEDYAQKWDMQPEQMAYVRRLLRDDYFGSWDFFNQERPVSPEVAFMFTGLPWYDQDKIAKAIEAAKTTPPLFQGDCDWATVDTPEVHAGQVDKIGPLMVWQWPDKKGVYVLGGDVGEGVGADYSSLIVWRIDGDEPEIVAHWRRNDRFGKPTPTGIKAYQLGAWYGWALAGIENNGPGGGTLGIMQNPPAAIPQMKIPYPNLYYHTVTEEEKRNPEESDTVGWPTRRRSKEMVMNDFAELIAHQNPKIPSLPLLLQMQEMKWIPGTKDRPGSKKGDWICTYKDPRTRKCHDDENMSAGIGLQMMLAVESGRVSKKQQVEREGY